MAPSAIDLPLDAIAEICREHRVAELSLFGSALRDDFRPDSDLDFLVMFEPGAQVSLFDMVDLEQALEHLLGRDVDVISHRGVEQSTNPYRKQAILGKAVSQVIAG